MSFNIASIVSSTLFAGTGINTGLVRLCGLHAMNVKFPSTTSFCAKSIINCGISAAKAPRRSGRERSRLIATDNSGSLVQSRPEILRRNCSCLATDSRIAVILRAKSTGFSMSISSRKSTVKPLSYHSLISSRILLSNLSIGIPDFLLLNLESAINDSNSASVKEAVGRSFTKPFRINSIHSLSNMERCLAALLARALT